jgi:hypothetical protein
LQRSPKQNDAAMNPALETKPILTSNTSIVPPGTRRSFLRKTTGAGVLSTITLLDLIYPLESHADSEGNTCQGYYANDEDGNCGAKEGQTTGTTDEDGACGKGQSGGATDPKDPDGNCGNSTNANHTEGDKDNACGYTTPSGSRSPDSSCGMNTGSSSKPDEDECCNSGHRADKQDTDQNCSGTEDQDQLCGDGQGSQAAGDQDQSCGWGSPAEADENCKAAVGSTVDVDSEGLHDPPPDKPRPKYFR